jgi:hypothetical protein
MTSSSSPSSIKSSAQRTEGDCLNEPSAQNIIPEGLLPAYLASAFGDLYEEDGLAVFGKGLGWLSLLACFARFYADFEDGHVAVMLEDNKKAKKSLGTTNIRHTRSGLRSIASAHFLLLSHGFAVLHIVLAMGLKRHNNAQETAFGLNIGAKRLGARGSYSNPRNMGNSSGNAPNACHE